MGVSLDWVQDYVDLQGISLEDLDSALRMSGLRLRQKHSEAGPACGEQIDFRQFDIEAPVSRQDWLGVLGIARELAARLGRPWKWHEPRPPRDPLFSVSPHLNITLGRDDDCHRLVALRLAHAPYSPSPRWMQDRLLSAGIKPNNLVLDSSRFVMLEYHQPVHAFDENRVQGAALQTTRATCAHKMITTDGDQLQIESGDLILEDSDGPVSLAGIADAWKTRIDSSTDRIILVCGSFSPSLMARTIGRLGLSREKEGRFAFGTDLTMLPYAALRVAELIVRGTEEALNPHSLYPKVQTSKDMVDLGVRPTGSRLIALRLSHCRELLGISDLTRTTIIQSLNRFAFRFVDGTEGRLVFEIPSFRPDVEREMDLIAELSRILGLDDLSPRSLPLRNKEAPLATSPKSQPSK